MTHIPHPFNKFVMNLKNSMGSSSLFYEIHRVRFNKLNINII